MHFAFGTRRFIVAKLAAIGRAIVYVSESSKYAPFVLQYAFLSQYLPFN
jgi:hypothetical protein